MQTANHKLRHNAGTAKKAMLERRRLWSKSPHLEVAPCQFVGQYDVESMRARWPKQRLDLLFPAE